ncbi:MAG: hypothetical protein IKR59_06055 [Lachnospiraceae bacterium]|nr:hypothetical protein [Lachnospiraceae bacterium]
MRQSVNSAVNGAVNNAVNNAVNSASNKVREISFSTLPTSLAEMQALPEASMTDPFAVAALTVVALNEYTINRDVALQMLDFLNGPNDVSQSDIQFLRDRVMDGHTYVARSYFKGATPDNNYTPTMPYTVKVMMNAYSQRSENYLALWIYSGGADSPREIQLRLKPSTGQWFANMWNGLLSGIRMPKADDPWA